MISNLHKYPISILLFFIVQYFLPLVGIGQNPIPIAFGENLEISLPEQSSTQAFSTPEVGPDDVLFIKIASGGLQMQLELFAPASATPEVTIPGTFSDDIELIYTIPTDSPTGEYTILLSNTGIWTGTDCITLQKMNEPPTAIHVGCDAVIESDLLCDSDIKAFKYLVEANTISRITVDGNFAPEAWICNSSGEILHYAATDFNDQLVLDSIVATETGCYYVFVSDDTAFWDSDFSISYTTLVGVCASVVIESSHDSDEVCEGDTLTLTASSSIANVSYTWTGPNDFVSIGAEIGLAAISLDQAGQYEVTASSAIVCTSKESRNIIVNEQPEVTAAVTPEDGTLCAGDYLNVWANTNGTFVLSYDWEGPDDFTSFFMSNTIHNSDVENSGVYAVTVTDLKGCTNADEVLVTVHPHPTANISSPSDEQVCLGATLVLNVDTNADDGIYSWSGPDGFTSTLQNPSINNVSSLNQGTYYVTVTDNTTGCSSDRSELIFVRPLPTATIIGETSICFGSSTILTANGGSGVTYEWDNGETSASIEVSPSSATTYTVTVTNTYGCTDTESVAIEVNSLPSLELSSTPTDPVICEDDGFILLCAASDAQSPEYSWSSEGFYMESQCITLEEATASGLFVAIVTDGITGCTNEMDIPIIIHPIPIIDITATPQTRLCNSEDFLLCANSDATNPNYIWEGPNNFTAETICAAQNNASDLYTGTYIVTVTASTGCSAIAEVQLEVGTPLQCNLGSTTEGIQATAMGSFPPYTYILSPGEQMNNTGIFENLSDDTYTVEVIDDNGCECTTSSIVIVGTSTPLAVEEIKVFPNPSNGVFHISLPKSPKVAIRADILNAAGLQVRTLQLGRKDQIIDIANLPAGVYWLHLRGAYQTEVRIVIMR